MLANKLTELMRTPMENSRKANQNRYYLMRHGESLANRRGIIVSHARNAIDHYGLTALGCEQVTKAAMQTRLDRHTIIVSSDYKRALETAEIMKSVIDCTTQVSLEVNLRERDFGKYELTDQQHYDHVWQHDLTHPGDCKDKVESVETTLARSLKVIERLEQEHQNKTILLVGHGDVLQILLAYNNNINPRFHRSLSSIGNADIRALNRLELAMKSSA